MRPFLGVLLAATAVILSAQELPQTGGQQVYVTAIEVVADVRDASGNLPAGLKPSDFVVIEDGVERTVVGVDYLRAQRIAGAIDTSAPAAAATGQRPWHNVLYFETTLANGPGRVAAARKMMEHVDALIGMGTVDVVFANPTPVALVRNSRDAAAIKAALEKVATTSGINQLAMLRRDYLRDVVNLNSVSALKSRATTKEASKVPMDLGGKSSAPSTLRGEFDSAGIPQTNAMDTNSVRPYIEQEVRLISSFREYLTTWLSSYRRHVPRNLLLVSDGFDLDPVEFYGGLATSSAQVALRTYVSQSSLGGTAARMAELLAAGNWTTVSIPGDNNSDGWVDDATVSAIGRVHASLNRKQGGTLKAFFIRPHDPLNAVADATGGQVVANSAHLAGVLQSLDDRVKLTYQVDRKSDGKTRKIEVRARDPKLKVRAAHYATSSTPDSMAEARAIGLLKSAAYEGDLKTESTMEWSATPGPKKSGTLRALTDVKLIKQLMPAGAKGQFRISLAVQMGKEAVVVNRAVPDYDLTEGVFRFRTPLDLPATATGLVLVIEETTTGIWGSTRVEIPGAPAS